MSRIIGINVSGDRFAEKMRKCLCEMLILTLLKQRPMYTYEIAQELSRVSDGAFKYKAIHSFIYHLVDIGSIREEGQQVAKNRTRIYYYMTKDGQEYLNNIIKEYHELTNAANLFLAAHGEISEK